jgi:hypothetical protein
MRDLHAPAEKEIAPGDAPTAALTLVIFCGRVLPRGGATIAERGHCIVPSIALPAHAGSAAMTHE